MSRAWPSGRRARSPRDMASARRRRGALRRPGRAAPTRAAGGQGGRCHERGLRAGGQDRRGIWRRRGGGGGVVLFDARGERLRPAPLEVKEGGVTSVAFGPEGQIAAGYGVAAAAAAWCSSTPGASGSDPRRWRSRRAMSRAWPSGRRARSPRDMRRRRRRRRGALRRPGRAAPTRAAGGQGGRCHERGLRAGGQDRRGIWLGGGVGGVVLFDARGERLRPAPLEVKEGDVTSVAFGPEGKIAAGYGGVGVGVGGVVLFDARGERLRPAPLEVKEGDVTSVAFGPEGKIAAGYGVDGGGGVVLFDARGERLRPAPLEVKEGDVTSVAFGPEGKIAAGYGVLASRRRRRGALRRPGRAAPTRAAGGQGGRCHERGLRAGGQDRRGIWRRRRRRRRGALRRPWRAAPTRAAGGQGGLCQERGLRAGGQDRRGISRLRRRRRGALRRPWRAAPTRAAGGQGGRGQERGLRAGGQDRRGIWRRRRRRRRRGALRRPWRAAPTRAAGGQGGLCHERGLRAGGPDRRGIFGFGFSATAAAWCSSTPVASGSDPRRWRSRRAMSGAWPSGRRAGSPRDMASRQRRPRRRGALRRPGRAAPTRAAGGQGGQCHERGLRAGGQDRRGICARGGGVVLFDADPASWLRKAGQTANRNFTRLEWTRYFPETSYRRTIRSLPWPHDLPEAERKQAEAFEKEHPEGSDAS